MSQCIRTVWIHRNVPSAWALGTRHPVEVTFEAVPLVDEEEDGDGWDSEDNDYEEVADFGDSFSSKSFFAGLCSLSAAGAEAATYSFAKARAHDV